MKKLTTKGNFITCQNCNFKFKFSYTREKINWEKNKFSCPICKELYCNKPLTERKLFKLQDEYYDNNKDSKIFDKMIKIFFDYAQSLIKKSYSSYISCNADLEYYTNNAVAFLVEEYLVKSDFVMLTSFGGLLIRKIKHAFFKKEEKDIPGISLNWEHEDGNEVSYEDKKYNYVLNLEDKDSTIDLYNYVLRLIFSIEEFCDPYEDWKRLLAIHHYLKFGEKEADYLFQEKIVDENGNILQNETYSRYAKEKYLNTLDLLKKELLKSNKKSI